MTCTWLAPCVTDRYFKHIMHTNSSLESLRSAVTMKQNLQSPK